ncbi:MAG: tetratricopeptide repeat protein [Planctomycetota bacterium]|jgi:tetratricopeptide (TPR) repeat protein
MSKNDSTEPAPSPAGADPFFGRAEQVAETGNWDFAIKMYLDGIRRDPDNVERGHQPLRKVSLTRKHGGGKGAGMMDKFKLKGGKDHLENLIRAEGVLAKEPGNLEAMQAVLRSAQKLELTETIPWICAIMLEGQKVAKRPSKRTLVDIANAFAALELFGRALEAADMAKQLDSRDAELHKLVTMLSTQHTMQKGKYGQEGDFTKGVKDMDEQMKLAQEDAMVKDKRYLEANVESSRSEYLQSPTVPGKINAYVDALLKFEDDAHENQAVDVLNKGHEATGAYQFKLRIGDVRIRQMTRRFRELKEADRKVEAAQQARQQLAFELEEYAERAVNYPTDLSIRYELGKRQYLAGKHDDAIASLQRASNDPRRRLQAMLYLGRSFAKKDWLREAVKTYEDALAGDVPEQRTKELLYELGLVLERTEDWEKAEDTFSRLAQIDYQYKDVRDHIEEIRKRRQEADPT